MKHYNYEGNMPQEKRTEAIQLLIINTAIYELIKTYFGIIVWYLLAIPLLQIIKMTDTST